MKVKRQSLEIRFSFSFLCSTYFHEGYPHEVVSTPFIFISSTVFESRQLLTSWKKSCFCSTPTPDFSWGFYLFGLLRPGGLTSDDTVRNVRGALIEFTCFLVPSLSIFTQAPNLTTYASRRWQNKCKGIYLTSTPPFFILSTSNWNNFIVRSKKKGNLGICANRSTVGWLLLLLLF